MMKERVRKEKETKKNLSELEMAEQRIRRNAELTPTVQIETQEEIAEFWENDDD